MCEGATNFLALLLWVLASLRVESYDYLKNKGKRRRSCRTCFMGCTAAGYLMCALWIVLVREIGGAGTKFYRITSSVMISLICVAYCLVFLLWGRKLVNHMWASGIIGKQKVIRARGWCPLNFHTRRRNQGSPVTN